MKPRATRSRIAIPTLVLRPWAKVYCSAAGRDRQLHRCASTFIDGGDHVVVLGRYGGTMKDGGATLSSPFCHVYRFSGDKAVMFQQYTDTAQWARLMS